MILSVERKGDRVLHRVAKRDAAGKVVAEFAREVHYAIGSGTRGFSYLTEKDGFVTQSPVSRFTQKNLWDLSPGFGEQDLVGRPVLAECLFCHVNEARTVPGLLYRYDPPHFRGLTIGCERCHGPGGLHVASGGERALKGADPPTARWPATWGLC